ncbi:GTPase, partial [Vibrio anguillarum]|nr:GTPase [Vibrio anguillarum]
FTKLQEEQHDIHRRVDELIDQVAILTRELHQLKEQQSIVNLDDTNNQETK